MRVVEKICKGLMMLVLVAVIAVLLGVVVEHLWNWLMPGIFGLRRITYWEAVGLLVLSKLLLGGFHPRGRNGGRARWKRKMAARWAGMSTEEREAFRAGMKEKRGCGWSREEKERFRAEMKARWGRGARGVADNGKETV